MRIVGCYEDNKTNSPLRQQVFVGVENIDPLFFPGSMSARRVDVENACQF